MGGRGLIRFVQLNPVIQKTLKLQYVKEIFCLIKFAFVVSALSGEMLVNTVDVQETRV